MAMPDEVTSANSRSHPSRMPRCVTARKGEPQDIDLNASGNVLRERIGRTRTDQCGRDLDPPTLYRY